MSIRISFKILNGVKVLHVDLFEIYIYNFCFLSLNELNYNIQYDDLQLFSLKLLLKFVLQ